MLKVEVPPFSRWYLDLNLKTDGCCINIPHTEFKKRERSAACQDQDSRKLSNFWKGIIYDDLANINTLQVGIWSGYKNLSSVYVCVRAS